MNINPTYHDIERWLYRDFIDTLDYISYLLHDGQIPFEEFGFFVNKKHKLKPGWTHHQDLTITYYITIIDLQNHNNILKFKYKSYLIPYYEID